MLVCRIPASDCFDHRVDSVSMLKLARHSYSLLEDC